MVSCSQCTPRCECRISLQQHVVYSSLLTSPLGPYLLCLEEGEERNQGPCVLFQTPRPSL